MILPGFQRDRPSKIFSSLLLSLFLFLSAGCIRLSANAGYWKQGPDDPYPTQKKVGFDTQNLVDRNQTKGNIEMGAQ